MDTFLAGIKSSIATATASGPFNVVLGNESGDLDSVVCSATLAFHLTAATGVTHVPLMAFDRRDLGRRACFCMLDGYNFPKCHGSCFAIFHSFPAAIFTPTNLGLTFYL